MDTDAALLAAIRDNPADDLPRLVYADFLDERGDGDRAEFIRVQIELATKPDDILKLWDIGHYSDRGIAIREQSRRLRQREQELLAANWAVWSSGVPGHWFCCNVREDATAAGRSAITFRRGFVDEVRCRLSDWVGGPCPRCGYRGCEEPPCLRSDGIGPAVLAAHPVTRVTPTGVTLTVVGDHAHGLCHWPRGLDREYGLPAEIELLHSSPDVARKRMSDALLAVAKRPAPTPQPAS